MLSDQLYFSGLPPARPSSNHSTRTKSGDQLSKVKEDIQTVTKTMQNNMNKVLDRGTKLEDLQDKTGAVLCDVSYRTIGDTFPIYKSTH